MKAEQVVHFLSHPSPRPLCPVAHDPSCSYSLTGTLLSIQPYADCGSREVGRGQGR